MKKIISLIIAVFVFAFLKAQSSDTAAEMADRLRADGKIYVVVAVIVAILAGLILYLVRLDRRISKLEKKN